MDGVKRSQSDCFSNIGGTSGDEEMDYYEYMPQKSKTKGKSKSKSVGTRKSSRKPNIKTDPDFSE